MTDIQPEQNTPEIFIQSVEFSEGYEAIGISYVERRNVSERGYKQETITLDAKLLPQDERDDLIDTLQQWIDSGLLHLRQEGGGSGD